jgi:hypothetical protein
MGIDVSYHRTTDAYSWALRDKHFILRSVVLMFGWAPKRLNTRMDILLPGT